jgi:hypothetical protein
MIDFMGIFGVRKSHGHRHGFYADPELKKWQRYFRKVDDALIDDDAAALGNGDGDSSESSRHISHLADLLCETRPDIDRGQVLRWLLRTKTGQALVRATKRFKQRQERQMPESFEKMVADMGIERIAKAITERGYSTAISEAEYTSAVTTLAVKRFPDKPRDVAFARLFGEQTEQAATLRKAHAIIKNFPAMVTIMPVQVDKATADPEDALAALNKLAEEEVRRDPRFRQAKRLPRSMRPTRGWRRPKETKTGREQRRSISRGSEHVFPARVSCTGGFPATSGLHPAGRCRVLARVVWSLG